AHELDLRRESTTTASTLRLGEHVWRRCGVRNALLWWNGIVWLDTALHRMKWPGMAWHGMALHGIA
ncbi:hypothetical protein M433DRAFT_10603, partial [Acidomyces richmondensis BFW]